MFYIFSSITILILNSKIVLVYQNKHERFGILGKMIYFCREFKQ